uniref:Putative secreted protein n=1 Tax=Ixodes ricinus TaxID=34613 RepID=A0A6B0TYS0_IXORI
MMNGALRVSTFSLMALKVFFVALTQWGTCIPSASLRASTSTFHRPLTTWCLRRRTIIGSLSRGTTGFRNSLMK